MLHTKRRAELYAPCPDILGELAHPISRASASPDKKARRKTSGAPGVSYRSAVYFFSPAAFLGWAFTLSDANPLTIFSSLFLAAS